ncbi:aldehyde dehydrogenase family protein [Candidatus Giovannonibacteria bacterium]|nr:aldehyde dehydrogenase family protein [Candidatus Giovannonibacteria bacterium]
MSLMLNNVPHIRKPENSPFVSFASGTKERSELLREIDNIRRPKTTNDIETLPLWIGEPVINGNDQKQCTAPHDFKRVLAYYSCAKESHVAHAIKTVLNARKKWQSLPWQFRLSIFQTAARLLETKYLFKLVAAVMEDYSKNPYEAFIDVQELIDFWNFNCYFASTIYAEQPASNVDTVNMLDYRPLEGFVYAVPPNNFIAIEGNLPTAPLIMGNVVIVKPSSDVVYSFHLVLKILHEAGLPKDVLAVLHGDSKMISDVILESPMLSGVHFTGGTDVFNEFHKRIGQNIEKYRGYPRIVGETGGKDPIVVYDKHDPIATAAAIVVGGFGAQGRKCSATSRVYMSCDMWEKVRKPLLNFMDKIRVGDVADFRNYMGASINEREHKKILGYYELAANGKHWTAIYVGGNINRRALGWFIQPIVVVTKDPHAKTMEEEIFGPIVTICILPRSKFEKTVLKLCDETSPYALTGAVHTDDIYQFCEALDELKYAAGNIYNWKTTGAMVAAQPFSGGRKSGTNSKVGWRLNLYQWTEPRTIGQTLVKPTDFAPPYLDRE